MLAPEGAPASSVNVFVWPAFASVAVAVNATADPSLTVLLPIAVKTGAAFPEPTTVTLIVSKSTAPS
jgi:hypothetical protein